MIQGHWGNDVCRISRIERFALEDVRDIGKLLEVDGPDIVRGFDAAQDQGLVDLVQATAVIWNGGAGDIGGEVDAHSARRPPQVPCPVPLSGCQCAKSHSHTHLCRGLGALIQCDGPSDGRI